MDHAHRGESALTAGKHEEAIHHYTEALKQSPSAATYHIKRSTAHQRVSNYQEALQDAEIAVVLAKRREKRELIAQAQLRRGIALFHLERYADAEYVFGLAKKLDEKEKSLGIWQAKVKAKLNDQEDSAKEVTVKDIPDVELPSAQPSKSSGGSATTAHGSTNGTVKPEIVAHADASTQQTPVNKIRQDWYQNNENIYFSLLVKGVPKDQATIDIHDRSLSISFPLSTGSTYDFSLDPLFAQVDPASSSSKVLSTKIEIVLKKSVPGQKWPALEGTATESTSTVENGASDAVKRAVLSPPATTGPVYPTSSRTGPKNWDKIANSYTKPAKAHAERKTKTKDKGKGKKKSGSEAEHDASTSDSEKDDQHDKVNEDEYIDEFEDGDEVNGFFKKLYKDASPDVRRAMMKSYQESGGTALSTNWDEVGKAPVPISPPDGMEAKKWEY